jgi:hypothetical protein
VLNRTHWEESGMVEILPECKPTYDESEELFLVEHSLALEVGAKYIVNLNGTEYTATATDASATFGDGIILLANDGADMETGEGAVFFVINTPEGALINELTGATELTISIYQDGETIHKLDNKFLDLAWLPTMEEAEILAEQTVTADGIRQDPLGSGVLVYPASMKGTIDLNETTEVVVKVDGTKYDAYYIAGSGVTIISASAIAPTAIAGKFYAYWTEGKGTFCHVTEGEHTFTVYGKAPNKLPESFMPESVDGIIIRSSTADSTKKFKLTVDDNGTISATEV